MPGGPKYWRSSKCERTILALSSRDAGASKPCPCGRLDCIAVVEQGAVACQVVGSSPAHEYGE
jgi:hypothetical protein